MTDILKRIGISIGVFAGVLILMYLAAKAIIMTSAGVMDGVTDKEALIAGFNAGGKGKDTGKADLTDSQQTGVEPVADKDDPSSQMPDAPEDNNTPGSFAGSDREEADPEVKDASDSGNEVNTDTDAGAETAADGVAGTDEDADRPLVVCIDPAHQSKADIGLEPIGPGSSETKYKVNVGATGTTTKGPEYATNLAVGLKLKEVLIGRGYEVVMTREENDVNISDSERAKLANASADIVIHIHCNADETRDTMSGIMAFEPSEDNPYVEKDVRVECARLGSCLIEKLAEATGAKNWGVIRHDSLTALNWTKIPASHIEIGYLTNPDEDRLLQTDAYRQTVADALADGIDLFFGKQP